MTVADERTTVICDGAGHGDALLIPKKQVQTRPHSRWQVISLNRDDDIRIKILKGFFIQLIVFLEDKVKKSMILFLQLRLDNWDLHALETLLSAPDCDKFVAISFPVAMAI